MHLDLTDEEAAALTKHLRQALDYHRYPLAPRLDPLKAILAKLDPPKPKPEPLPPLRPGMGPRVAASLRSTAFPVITVSRRPRCGKKPVRSGNCAGQLSRGRKYPLPRHLIRLPDS
jgi:hypothetical protein